METTEKEALWVSPVFRGMLRRPRIFGVPIEGFQFNVFGSMLFFVLVNPLVAFVVIFPAVHIALYFLTKFDPDFLEILKMAFKFNNVKGRDLTGAKSYVP